MSLALTIVCAQTVAAQTFVDLPPAAVAPSSSARRREEDALRAPRARWRPAIEGGVAVLSGLGRANNEGLVDWSPALTLALGLDARRAIGDLLEIHGRLEFLGPQVMTVVPRALSERVAGMACAGSRAFGALPGWGAQAGLSFGVRTRVFSLRSPFYVGLAMRVGLWAGSASGESVAYCVNADHSVRTLGREEASVGSTLIDLGGTLETGFRFGAREEGVLSLRLLAGGVGLGDPAVRGALLTLGWSLR
jgi:hypothetical protein